MSNSIILAVAAAALLLPPSHPLSPPEQGGSLSLTKDLLGLDLGYNIAKEELLRTALGAGVDGIDRADVGRSDYDYYDGYDEYEVEGRGVPDDDSLYEDVSGDDDDSVEVIEVREVPEDKFFFGEEELEVLPAPHHLVRESGDFGDGDSGPNPVGFWIDPTFWGRNPGGGGGGSWGPFGGRPGRRPPPHHGGRPPRPPRPPHHRPPPPHHHFGGPPDTRKRSRPAQKTFVGDQHQCQTGSCEFFLFCWLSGGVIENGCGGFLFACCQRPRAHGPGGGGSDVIVARVSPEKRSQIPKTQQQQRVKNARKQPHSREPPG